jgi:small subunit ribosomal protein S16
MLKIRLQRVGKKHEPVFRVVVGNSQNGPKSGKFIEVLGSYDPRSKNQNTLNKDKVTAWIAKGAQVSDTVHNLLVSEKVIDKKKVNSLPKKTAPKKEVVAEEVKAPAPEVVAEAPVVETTPEVVEETPVEATPEEVAPEAVESVVEAESIEEAPVESTEEGTPDLAIEDEEVKSE